MSPVNGDNLISSYSIWVPCISFSFLTALARTSSTTLDKNIKSGHPCLISNLRKLFPIQYVHCWLNINDLYFVEVYSLEAIYSAFLLEGIRRDAFSPSIEIMVWFLFFILLIWFITFTDLCILK